MLYKQIEEQLLDDDDSKKNIQKVITELESNSVNSRGVIMHTETFGISLILLLLGLMVILISLLYALPSLLNLGILPNDCIPFFWGGGLSGIPLFHLTFITPIFFKEKCLKRLNNKLKKIDEYETEILASLDRVSLKIEDNNVKMIYNCVKIINEVKYEGWEKDLTELESLYKEYMNIQVKRKLTTEPMLNSRELEISARIGEINSKLEIIKLEFALKNSPFVKKVYMKIMELKNLNYNGVKEHIALLNNLVNEYILYKRTIPVNEKVDFGTEEKLKEAEFENRYDDICYLIKVYQSKDQNDKILGSMFDIARGIKLDDSIVNLDVGLEDNTTLGLRKKL